MIDPTLQDLMQQGAKTANFDLLFDRLSDDVDLKVTMSVASSTCSERRGRQSVIRHLQSLGSAGASGIEEPTEFFADGARCVVCHDEGIAIPNGFTLRCERTFVFDVHEGLVTRIAIHYELSPAVSRHPIKALPIPETAAEA